MAHGSIPVTLTDDEARHVKELLDREVEGHHNRLTDYVLWYEAADGPDTREGHLRSAVRAAKAAEKAVSVRAKFVQALDEHGPF